MIQGERKQEQASGGQADVTTGHARSQIYLSTPDQLVPKDNTSEITGLKSGIPQTYFSLKSYLISITVLPLYHVYEKVHNLIIF